MGTADVPPGGRDVIRFVQGKELTYVFVITACLLDRNKIIIITEINQHENKRSSLRLGFGWHYYSR